MIFCLLEDKFLDRPFSMNKSTRKLSFGVFRRYSVVTMWFKEMVPYSPPHHPYYLGCTQCILVDLDIQFIDLYTMETIEMKR